MSIALSGIKQVQQGTWASGNYALVGARIQLMAERLCEAADVRATQKVIDVACGSGNTAIAAARRFCDVTGVDFVPELLDVGRARADAEGLPVAFVEGDAEDIPFPDASFDVALSTVGVMFTPNPEQAAGELLRVVRPGGRIGVASWTPQGFVGTMFKTVAAHVPPPPDVPPPVAWGTEERIRELFGDQVEDLRMERRIHVFRYPSVEFFVDFFRAYYGPTLRAFGTLDDEGKVRLAADLAEIARQSNTSGDDTLVQPSEYLEVVATKT